MHHFHTLGTPVFHHAAGYGGYSAAHGLLTGVAHTVVHALIYSAMFRLLRHVPLPLLIGVIVIVVFMGYRHAQRTGRRIF